MKETIEKSFPECQKVAKNESKVGNIYILENMPVIK